MSDELRNCVHCAWCRGQTEIITQDDIQELYYRCSINQKLILLRIAHIKSCPFWMQFKWDPVQLDYFGNQTFGRRLSR